MLGNLPDPILVTRPGALKQLADELSREPIVAVDTESNSLYVYREQVCLIQFSTSRADYLVDPLALKDLTPLSPIFANPAIEKVFHAVEYDLICLRRDFEFSFENLFDTMVAARVLGREGLGLGSLLEQEFDIHLDKRFQRADWGQRPLPPALLAYARLDTHYLLPLRNRLKAELDERKLLPLAVEDFCRMAETGGRDGRTPDEKILDCWRISGSYDLNAQQAAVLLELCRYRDQAARSVNRPLFKVLSDNTLLSIASVAPRSLENLGHLPGMTPGQLRRHGEPILNAVQRGQRAEPIYPPRQPRPDDQYLERLEALRRWRKAAALDMGVASDVVLPRDLLYSLASHNPRDLGALAGVMQDVPWRLEHFGERILHLLSNLQTDGYHFPQPK